MGAGSWHGGKAGAVSGEATETRGFNVISRYIKYGSWTLFDGIVGYFSELIGLVVDLFLARIVGFRDLFAGIHRVRMRAQKWLARSSDQLRQAPAEVVIGSSPSSSHEVRREQNSGKEPRSQEVDNYSADGNITGIVGRKGKSWSYMGA